MDSELEIKSLKETINYHSNSYYVLDDPEISDFEFDALVLRLKELEAQNPHLITDDSPTQKVGGTALTVFSPVRHEIPLQSLNDVFSFDELFGFISRVIDEFPNTAEFSVEPKIDGLSVSLEYENGVFIRGSTRGDGSVGEDVTHNLRTIKSLPLALKNAPERLTVRGEVYMNGKVFDELNAQREILGETLFKNPRNAAAGSMRQLDPKITAARKLDIVVFNIQCVSGATYQTHGETLEQLKKMGFQTVPYKILITPEECGEEISRIGREREKYPFDIDGAVVKLNSLSDREYLGSTSKAPRWAAAYKYPPEKKETRVVDITVQVGRTGVLTPKAVVEPVLLAGTTVSNATLHNQDFIDGLDVRVGDTVLVQKAGEIIPEVLEVILSKRPEGTIPYKLPESCPICGSKAVRDEDGAALRCTGAECPAQKQRNIVHFASRHGMDIDRLGSAIVQSLIDADLINSPAELYYLEKEKISVLPGMGEKSASNLIAAIEDSKSRGLQKLLCAFGIRQIGQKAAKTIAKRFCSLDELMRADVDTLTAIEDVGPVTANFLISWFSDPQSLHQINMLRNAGVSFDSIDTEDFSEDGVSPAGKPLYGKTFVLTGTLSGFTRDEAAKLIEEHGGNTSASVSKKTSFVVAGENAGSKLEKAISLQIPILSESEFLKIISESIRA